MGALYSAFSGLPIPDSAGTNDMPYWLSQLVAAMDGRLVLAATSTADRDSKFFNAPSGVICVVRNSGTTVVTGVYVKTSDVGTSVWSTVWTAPVAPVPVAINLADGFQAANGKNPIAVYNSVTNTWTLWGNIGTVNSTNIGSNTTLGTLPAAVAVSSVQPYYEGASTISVSGTSSPPGTAKISITASGSIVVYMGSGVQTSWVGIDGIVLPGA